MAYIWDAEDDVEPISDSNIEGIANMANYAVLAGCGQSYSASDMVVTIAAGSVLYNGSPVTVAGNTVTLVADPTDPRWTWIVIDDTGTADIVSGTPAPIGPGTGPEVPELGGDVGIALILVPAGQTIASDITYKLDKRVFSPNSGVINKYKDSAQTASATTSFATVTAATGNFDFPIAANEVWSVEWYLPLTFTNVGGFKAQVTGPAAATALHFNEISTRKINTDNTSPLSTPVVGARAFVTAFSTAIGQAAADTSTTTADTWQSNAASNWIIIKGLIINGANAGTITLQFAQNSAAGTAVIGIGATMSARKLA